MEFEIKTYLANKDGTRYGTCLTCGSQVYWTRQKVESHLRSGNCAKDKLTMMLPREHDYSKTELPLTEFPGQNKAVESSTESQVKPNAMASVSMRKYINLLQQFKYLPLFLRKNNTSKKKYQSFIKILREILRNVRNGIVQFDEPLMKPAKRLQQLSN